MDDELDRYISVLSDFTDDAIVVLDVNGRIEFANAVCDEMLGRKAVDIPVDEQLVALIGAETSAKRQRHFATAVREGRLWQGDVVTRSLAGTRIVARVRAVPIKNASGQDHKVLLTLRDMTASHGQEDDLIDFTAYRTALDAQAIVSVADRRGGITFVNRNFCEISGYSEGELLGSNHRLVNSGVHDAEFFVDMWRTIVAGRTWHGEVCNRRKDGALYWVDTTVVPVKDRAGRIVRYVSIRYDITERKLAEERLVVLSETDVLTGLANRGRLRDSIGKHSRRAGSAQLALLLIDVDHFKDLNDSRGHAVGDLLLKKIAARMRRLSPEDAVLGRLGGDEFGVLLPLPPQRDEAEDFVTRFHKELSDPYELEGARYVPSFSVGAKFISTHDADADAILVCADIALYQAKLSGRNCVQFYTPSFGELVQRREAIKSALRHAIASDQITIRMQPIKSVQSDTHHGFEVLMRLGGDGSDLAPSDFIPVAEEFGYIVEIGRTVLRKALSAIRDMRSSGLDPGYVCLNFAPIELRDHGFVDTLLSCLDEFGVAPEDIVVELTETALIGRSVDTVAATLRRVREAGILLALDDFGTGFSSLSHLKNFDVDKLKIDKSFIGDLDSDDQDALLVSSLTRFGHDLGLTVVAEGVETEAQLAFLKRCGCDLAQGYLLARPLTVEDAVAYLRAEQAPDTSELVGQIRTG